MRVLGNPLARVTLPLGLPSEAFFPAVLTGPQSQDEKTVENSYKKIRWLNWAGSAGYYQKEVYFKILPIKSF